SIDGRDTSSSERCSARRSKVGRTRREGLLRGALSGCPPEHHADILTVANHRAISRRSILERRQRGRPLARFLGARLRMVSVLAQRLTAQLVAGAPARDPVAVVERLLAVQAQDARGARLAVRSRSAGLTAADVDRALTDARSLLVTWLNRGTLHLVRR